MISHCTKLGCITCYNVQELKEQSKTILVESYVYNTWAHVHRILEVLCTSHLLFSCKVKLETRKLIFWTEIGSHTKSSNALKYKNFYFFKMVLIGRQFEYQAFSHKSFSIRSLLYIHTHIL